MRLRIMKGKFLAFRAGNAPEMNLIHPYPRNLRISPWEQSWSRHHYISDWEPERTGFGAAGAIASIAIPDSLPWVSR